MFINSNDNKRYYTFNYFLRKKFNCKVYKVPIDAHASCPNKKTGGCIYCKDNSKSNITDSNLSIMDQYNHEVKILNQKWPDAKHIIYLQTGTNTYMPIDEFKAIIMPFLNKTNIVGIAIATRSDCLNEEYYEFFKELNQKTFLMIELGLQSANDDTLKLINRGHTVNNFKEAVEKLHQLKIFVVAHIINGLPNETKDDMLNTVMFLNNLKIEAIKIHMLHILKDTALENLYNTTHFKVLSKEEYIDIVISQLELLNKNVVIARMTGDPIIEDLIAPFWLTKKFILLNDIDKEMVKRNTFQGACVPKKNLIVE